MGNTCCNGGGDMPSEKRSTRVQEITFDKPTIQVIKHNLEEITDVTAGHDVCGGGTGQEFCQNLVKPGQEAWNKWYENESAQSWVSLELSKTLSVTRIGFVSADDCPHRDPGNAKVYFQSSPNQWTQIGDFNLSFGDRFECKTFDLSRQVLTTSFKIEFTNTQEAAELQLCEIQLFGYETPGDETSVKETVKLNLEEITEVTAGDDTCGGGTGKEFCQNLVKPGQEAWNKWYESTSADSYIKLVFSERLSISRIGFVSANDCPHRDPGYAKVYAKNDSHQLDEIGTFLLSFGDRFELQTFDLDRDVVTEVIYVEFSNLQQRSELQLCEIQLFKKLDLDSI